MQVSSQSNNYVVKWHHNHVFLPAISPKFKGSTVCIIVDLDKQTTVVGEAFCSMDDNFDKNKGRKLSMHRALLSSSLTKPTRGKFWKEYYKMRNESW